MLTALAWWGIGIMGAGPAITGSSAGRWWGFSPAAGTGGEACELLGREVTAAPLTSCRQNTEPAGRRRRIIQRRPAPPAGPLRR